MYSVKELFAQFNALFKERKRMQALMDVQEGPPTKKVIEIESQLAELAYQIHTMDDTSTGVYSKAIARHGF